MSSGNTFSLYPTRPGMTADVQSMNTNEVPNPEVIRQALSWEHELTKSENLTPDEREDTPGLRLYGEQRINQPHSGLSIFLLRRAKKT